VISWKLLPTNLNGSNESPACKRPVDSDSMRPFGEVAWGDLGLRGERGESKRELACGRAVQRLLRRPEQTNDFGGRGERVSSGHPRQPAYRLGATPASFAISAGSAQPSFPYNFEGGL
jgi:hypothetical protein